MAAFLQSVLAGPHQRCAPVLPLVSKAAEYSCRYLCCDRIDCHCGEDQNLDFEHHDDRKNTTSAFCHGGNDIEQVDQFNRLGMLMHGTKA